MCIRDRSQASYDSYVGEMAKDGTVVIDADLVEADGAAAVPFTTTAEEVGRKIVANMVMLGYLTALLDLVPPDVLEETVMDNIPVGTEELNRRALQAGRELFGGGSHDES